MIQHGNNNNNIIIGDNDTNTIYGHDGNDIIYGGLGTDTSIEGAAIAHLSAAVQFSYSTPIMQQWLSSPDKGYIQTSFSFQEDLPSDVIMGVDQEWFEGMNTPIHTTGGDWMALAGVTRNGILKFPYGTEDAHKTGTPTGTIHWESIDLGVELQADTSYQIRLEADFSQRRFISFSISGPNIDITVDLSDYLLDYPNLIPIDQASLTNYVFTFRAETFGASSDNTNTNVQFDNVQAGVLHNGAYVSILSDNIEQEYNITDLPISDISSIERNAIPENTWYNERLGANIEMSNGVLNSKTHLIDANTHLDQMDEIFGGYGDDTIFGEFGNDKLFGGHGNDQIIGGSGDDTLYGNQGDDALYGGWGFDNIYGGRGNDAIFGGGGNDFIHGGGGHDVLTGGTGEDTLKGGQGNDLLYGGNNDDFLCGNIGNDIIYGESGNDAISAGKGEDIVFGGTGHDILAGGYGNDILFGESGNDYLFGTQGTDILIGGHGADTFVFLNLDTESDLVTDFSAEEGDRLHISNLLHGYDPLSHALSDFIASETFGTNDTYISVDKDGTGNAHGWELFVTLQNNTNIDIQELYNNEQIII